MKKQSEPCEVIVVGAGFAGLYALHRLRELGYSVCVVEAGDGIGGTWFWNRYPGARCDIESMQYSYSFSDEIQQEWNWTELFASQPEILDYINFVADKLDLRKDISLSTKIVSAIFDEELAHWRLTADDGRIFIAKFCIMATGCLSVPLEPHIEGIEKFAGEIYQTSRWPKDNVDLSGKRVALLGTGSSGIQATPIIAEQAAHLYVFQRTPSYTLPARNRPLDSDYVDSWKRNYRERRNAASSTRNNTLNYAGARSGEELTAEEREREFERRWQEGGSSSGIGFMYAFTDMTRSKVVNSHASDFVRRKISRAVSDPSLVEILTPSDHPIGARRLCVDTGYYETFNRPNVTLVDARRDPVERMSKGGIQTKSGKFYEVDAIVLAIGFDAMTGALAKMKILGESGKLLSDHWRKGPRTCMGLTISGFPNLFIVNGPGSPSVLSNMVTSIEQHVDWIVNCIAYVRKMGKRSIVPTRQAEAEWVKSVEGLAAGTVLSQADSWYRGANVEGKPRVVMIYLGGTDVYNRIINDAAASGYKEFEIRE